MQILFLLLVTLPMVTGSEDDGDDDRKKCDPSPRRTSVVYFLEDIEYVPYYTESGGIVKTILEHELERQLHDCAKKPPNPLPYPLYTVKQGKNFATHYELLDVLTETNESRIYEILNTTKTSPDVYILGSTTIDNKVKWFDTVKVIATRKAVLIVPIEKVILLMKFLEGIVNCFGITFFAICIAINLASVIWAIESRTNPDFQNTFGAGLWTSFWYCFVTMTTVGYGDKVPKHFVSRLLCLAWMLFGLMLTGIITTTVMESVQKEYVTSGKTIGVITNSSEAGIVDSKLGAFPVRLDSYAEMYDALINGQIEAILCEATIASFQYKDKKSLTMVSEYNLPSYVNAFIFQNRKNSVFDFDFVKKPIDTTTANSVKAVQTPPYQVSLYYTRSFFEIFDKKDEGVVFFTALIATIIVAIAVGTEIVVKVTRKDSKKMVTEQRHILKVARSFQNTPKADRLARIENNLMIVLKEMRQLRSLCNGGDGPIGERGVNNEAFTKI